MEDLSVGTIALRIGAALLCGAVVGIERERKQRPAGFRTMILISLGCCGFVLIGIESSARITASVMSSLPPGAPAPGQAELSRVLQGLMGGIGFVGAGAVLQSKRAVRGVTTAAAVWVVAALGAGCGLGLYNLVVVLGLATLFTLVVLDVVENRFFPDPNDGKGWESDERKKNGHKHHHEGDNGSERERDDAAFIDSFRAHGN